MDVNNTSFSLNSNQDNRLDYLLNVILIVVVIYVVYQLYTWYNNTNNGAEHFKHVSNEQEYLQREDTQSADTQRQNKMMNTMMKAQSASTPSQYPKNMLPRDRQMLANSQMLTSGLMSTDDLIGSPNGVQQRYIKDSNNEIINNDIPMGSRNFMNDDVSCNLSQNLSETDKFELKDFKNKFYSTYAHQVECGNKNQNVKTGCGKRCYSASRSMQKCKPDDVECLKEYASLNNGPDVIALNFLALENNNKRDCSTCTFDKLKSSRADGVESILNQLYGDSNVFKQDTLLNEATDSTFRPPNKTNKQVERFESQAEQKAQKAQQSQQSQQTQMEKSKEISLETQMKDMELANKKRVTFDNCNKFANFADYIDQNGVMETSVDKMAEIRTQDSATCGLKSYGKSIADVYDKLLNTPYLKYQKSCNLDNISGVFEDASPTSDFAELNKKW
jgi:hypothetical protein